MAQSDAERARTYRQRKKDKEAAVEIKASVAADILREWGVQNEHVVDLCVELAAVAAKFNKATFNESLFHKGFVPVRIDKTLVTDRLLTEPTGEDVIDGEVLRRKDLYALWYFGFWRWPDDSFEAWLHRRFELKSSAFEMSQILGKEDFGEKHQEWTEFCPKWDPRGLHPDYTQQQGLGWLDKQRSPVEGDKKKYLLVASRNSMKSTWARILCLCLTCCYPDARILIVSETNKLSKKGMREFRGYLEVRWNNPTLFQQYFPEVCVDPDDGSSLIYDNPIRHLGLPQNSVESSSMESANTGSRFDFALFDDPISRDNGTSDQEQREESVSKHGSIMKLREPAGFALNIQTPWVEDDLGYVMIARNEDDPERPLAVRIDPVMEVLPHARNKQILELTEQDVHLNFLPKLNWKFVRNEMRSPEGLNFFKTQYMCLWIKEDEGLRITFEENDLKNHTRHRDFFKGASLAQTVMVLDRSYSTALHADPSAIAILKIMPVQARLDARMKTSLVVWHVTLEKLKESELIDEIIHLCDKHKPSVFVSQKDKGQDDAIRFELAMRKQAMFKGVVLPYFRWIATSSGSNTTMQKARRMKTLEEPLTRDCLWFASGEWNDAVFAQFLKVGGGIFKSSNAFRKDDAPDAISQGYVQFMPKQVEEPKDPESEQQKRDQRERDAERERREMQHDAMFRHGIGRISGQGSNPPTHNVTTAKQWGNKPTEPKPAPAPEPAPAPVRFPRAGGMAVLPGNMRGRPRGA